jgi:hypothetical protein
MGNGDQPHTDTNSPHRGITKLTYETVQLKSVVHFWSGYSEINWCKLVRNEADYKHRANMERKALLGLLTQNDVRRKSPEFTNKGNNQCIQLLHTAHNHERENIDDNWNIF